ncbi:retinol dehydrogenase 11 isoform X2 [Cherax quadricarinatus]|uniref:retinol dehydrogenase 11 isoform X2 n=1 Tax=Cherax quadricarinatus TaxID=27406 RepID=UPI00387E794E
MIAMRACVPRAAIAWWIAQPPGSTDPRLGSGSKKTLEASRRLTNSIACRCQNRVREKVVIVTGSSSGIGHSTALDLARKGATVYLAFRKHKIGEAVAENLRSSTGNRSVYFLHLDLTDFSSIRSFVHEFSKREQRLDALVNNAAVFHHPPALTGDQIEVTYQTNYLGVFLLTQLLLKDVQRSPASRIVFVSSAAHKLVSEQDLLHYDPRELSKPTTFADHVRSYGLSKLAIHLFAQYIVETAPGVLVVLVDPGNVWTPIYRHSWQSWSEILTRLKCFLFMKSAQEGAQSTIHALNAPDIKSGQYISCLEVEGTQSYDTTAVQRLIAHSAQLTAFPRHSDTTNDPSQTRNKTDNFL